MILSFLIEGKEIRAYNAPQTPWWRAADIAALLDLSAEEFDKRLATMPSVYKTERDDHIMLDRFGVIRLAWGAPLKIRNTINQMLLIATDAEPINLTPSDRPTPAELPLDRNPMAWHLHCIYRDLQAAQFEHTELYRNWNKLAAYIPNNDRANYPSVLPLSLDLLHQLTISILHSINDLDDRLNNLQNAIWRLTSAQGFDFEDETMIKAGLNLENTFFELIGGNDAQD